ncbi:MAG: hypothetical protein KGJ86_01510 [Chloroflexota bacterium]|nr:hypothetical protein [Chloroflexota bacterium]
MRAAIIANPRAGRGRAVQRAQQARAELSAAGVTCELACTDGAGSATTLAREYARAGCELVFAAGGDGTINEVVEGIVGSGAILGVVPAGLANVWASEVGIDCGAGAFGWLIRHGLIFDTDLGLVATRMLA